MERQRFTQITNNTFIINTLQNTTLSFFPLAVINSLIFAHFHHLATSGITFRYIFIFGFYLIIKAKTGTG